MTKVFRRLDKIQLSSHNATASENLKEVLETAQGPMSNLYNKQRILKPTQIQAITRAKWEFIAQRRIKCLWLKIASQPPAEINLNQLPVVEDEPDLPPLIQSSARPGLAVDHEPEDESSMEMMGDKEESVADNTDKQEANTIQEVIY